MPIFEFSCGRCGREFERLVTASAGRVCCPACNSVKVAKKFSVFGSRSAGKFTSSQGSGCTSCSKASCSSCK